MNVSKYLLCLQDKCKKRKTCQEKVKMLDKIKLIYFFILVVQLKGLSNLVKHYKNLLSIFYNIHGL